MGKEGLQIVRETVGGLRVGPPLSDRDGRLPHVAVYPIFPNRLNGESPDTISLSDGGDGGALIQEVSCEDAVRISNPLDFSLYGGESECIIGRTQNRALKHDVLVPPRTSRFALVNCVEKGQPTRHGKGMVVDGVSPWSIRLDKMRQLAEHGKIGQDRVWDQVETFLKRAKVSSRTLDLHAMYEKRGAEIQPSQSSFPYLPGQVGAISAVGPNLFVDLFSEPEMLERRFDGILSSAFMEGYVAPSDVRVPMDVARRCLDDLLAGVRHQRKLRPRFSSPDESELLMWGPDITASAFISKGDLRHLSFHRSPGNLASGGAEFERGLEDFRRHYHDENREWLKALRDAYAPRHRSYQARISELMAFAPSHRMQARALAKSAGPVPGPVIGVEEAEPDPEVVDYPDSGVIQTAIEGLTGRVSDDFSADLCNAEAFLDGLKLKMEI